MFFAEARRVLRPPAARWCPRCIPREMIMAALRAGFAIEHVGEHAPDAGLAARYPRAEKYVGWPMLVLLRLAAGPPPG